MPVPNDGGGDTVVAVNRLRGMLVVRGVAGQGGPWVRAITTIRVTREIISNVCPRVYTRVPLCCAFVIETRRTVHSPVDNKLSTVGQKGRNVRWPLAVSSVTTRRVTLRMRVVY